MPFLHRPIHILLQPRLRFVRPVIGVAFLLGGLLSFLPVFGIWMLPLGLLVLALDFPLIQPLVSSLFIRGRRGISRAWRQVKSWRRPDAERG